MRGLVRLTLVLAGAAFAQPAVAQPQPDRELIVQLSNFRFSPATLILKQGQTYRIHFENVASGGHDFVAREFFAASQIAAADQGKVANGEIDLAGHESVDIELTPQRAGQFRSHCSHFMHGALGMKGQIIVEPASG